MLPVFPETAMAAGVPLLDYTLFEQPHQQMGNAMHVGVFIAVQVALYSCIALNDQHSLPRIDAPLVDAGKQGLD
jgi:hypothetical protein